MPATHNDWSIEKSATEIDNFAELFRKLGKYLEAHPSVPLRRAL